MENKTDGVGIPEGEQTKVNFAKEGIKEYE